MYSLSFNEEDKNKERRQDDSAYSEENGFSTDPVNDDFEERYLAKIARFIDKQYILPTKNGYRLSRRGLLISNYILSEILEF